MDLNNFKNVATNCEIGSKLAWTDEELLEAIQVHQCLVAYFSIRKESMIAYALRSALTTFEGFANARKWEEKDGIWRIRRKDGTLV